MWKRSWGEAAASSGFPALTFCVRGYKGGKKNLVDKPSKKIIKKGDRDTTPTNLPTSLDISEKEGLIDVEKYFPEAVKHLRSTSRIPEVDQNRLERRWHRQVHTVNVDGLPLTKEKKSESFFDQDNLNIRQNASERSRSHGMDLPSRNEHFSPDILRITGGNPYEHGLALAETSNAAPADITLEGGSAEQDLSVKPTSSNTDIPTEMTDMLKERLMELKTQKLREDRFTSYLPKRLNLASDAEVAMANALRRSQTTPRLEQSPHSSSGAPSSLADLPMSSVRSDGEHENGMQRNAKSESLDSVSDNSLADAEAFIQGSLHHIPGGLDEATLRHRDAHSTSRHLRTGESKHLGEVYLLRTLARAGFCSRREAEGIISSGQVRVNNVVERNAFRLVRAEDDIHVAGHQSRLRFAPPRLWMYHKPANVIVSRHDVAGRTLITKHASILGIDHLIPVGSLPMRAHGVLLLTNDGELSRFLEDPDSMIQQTYLLRVRPAIDPLLAHKFNTKGITINGRQLRGVEFIVNPSMKSRFSVKVKLRGENIPIHQLMQHIGRTVERGGRISVGPFTLGQLAVGSIREVTVPPQYTEHAGREWKTFVERDWPYFRRRRVVKLRKLSRYRELTPKEVEELENATYTEIHESLAIERSELDASVPYTVSRPVVDIDPIPFTLEDDVSNDIAMNVMDDVIQKDIANLNVENVA